jgi:hypothetical protein
MPDKVNAITATIVVMSSRVRHLAATAFWLVDHEPSVPMRNPSELPSIVTRG